MKLYRELKFLFLKLSSAGVILDKKKINFIMKICVRN